MLDKTVRQLEDATNWLAAIVSSSTDAIVGKTMDGVVVSFNLAAERLFGYRTEEIVGESLRVLIPVDRQEEEDRILAQIAAGERVEHYETIRLHKNGSRINISVSVSPVRDASGRIIGAAELARDITGRKQTEGALRESEERLRLFIESAPASIAQFDRQMRYIAASRRWLKDYGLDGDIAGRSHYEVFPEISEAWKDAHCRTLAGESLGSEGDLFTREDGSIQWVKWETLPWRNADGGIGGVMIASEDITARKEAEEALRESEARLQAVLDSSPDPIFVKDRESRQVLANPAMFLAIGKPAEACLGKTDEQFLDNATDGRAIMATDRRIMASGQSETVEEIIFTPFGTRYFVSNKAPFRDAQGNIIGLIGTARDVTELRRAEAALRESENRYKTLVEQTTDGIFLAARDGHYIDVNFAGCDMLGMTREEVLASTFTDVLHPDELARLPAAIASMADGKVHCDEWRYRRKDGSSFIGELVGRKLPNGCFQGVLRDITARKKAEEQTKLLLKEVNHRAKNMLTLVQAIARRSAVAGTDDFLDRFGARIQALAANQDLLVKGEWKGVDLSELVHSQLASFQDLIGSSIEIGGPPLSISAPAAQALGMAIHELATNAGKYGSLSAIQGRVAISWGFERDGAGSETFIMNWREQGGPPVAPPSKMGFGSTVIGALAESNLDAKVDLDYLVTGLSWRLNCPAAAVIEGTRAQPAAEERFKPRASNSSSPKVLVVEDEALVAMEIADVLRTADFEVIGPAKTVAQALSLIEQTGCDAAVLDINLGGGETSEAVARKLLSNRTVFVTLSGYSRTQHPPIFDGVRSLDKPLRPALLVAEIMRCLSSKENRKGQLSN